MKVEVTKIFCSIISGLALFLVAIPILYLTDVTNYELFKQKVVENQNTISLIGVVVSAYLMGIVFNSIGLVFDNYCGGFLRVTESTQDQANAFYKNASEHLFIYRDHVWAYYFCYRNLFMLILPGIIGWCGMLWHSKGIGTAIIVFIVLVTFEIILYNAMRTLLDLYYKITNSM